MDEVEQQKMSHPLVTQLRFTRSEWQRALDGISDADARHRLEPMNCMSWMLGHLAWHEQSYWLERAQGKTIVPELTEVVGPGRPASTPPFDEMQQAWQAITTAADRYLETLTTESLQTHMTVDGKRFPYCIGTMLQRVIYHYWFHTGEAMAIRQLLGQRHLPEFVGDIQVKGPYRPE
jgi:uncharacterized damage-inducible protein DinB